MSATIPWMGTTVPNVAATALDAHSTPAAAHIERRIERRVDRWIESQIESLENMRN